MKKVLSTITVFLYFPLSCGVMVNLYYCVGNVQSVQLYAAEKKACDKCGMPLHKTKGCCREEVKIFRLQNDQNTTHASYVLKNIQTPSIIPSEFIATSGSAAKISFHNIDHSPPPLLSGSETYLQNCVFRI